MFPSDTASESDVPASLNGVPSERRPISSALVLSSVVNSLTPVVDSSGLSTDCVNSLSDGSDVLFAVVVGTLSSAVDSSAAPNSDTDTETACDRCSIISVAVVSVVAIDAGPALAERVAIVCESDTSSAKRAVVIGRVVILSSMADARSFELSSNDCATVFGTLSELILSSAVASTSVNVLLLELLSVAFVILSEPLLVDVASISLGVSFAVLRSSEFLLNPTELNLLPSVIDELS